MTDIILKYLMPQKLIDFVLKAKEFLKGKKVYLAATIILLQSLLSYIDQTLALVSMGDFIIWCKGLGSNDATIHLIEALAIFGIRAAFPSGKKEEKK